MMMFLELRDRLKAFYGRYTTALDIVLKFILAAGTFFFINALIGFNPLASGIFTTIVLALLCSILPLRAVPIFGAVLICIQAFSLGYDAGAAASALLLVLLILFLRFVPDDSLIVVLLPMAIFAGAPAVVPICYGLKRKPLSVVSVASGVIVYYLIDSLHRLPDAASAASLGSTDYAQRLQILMNGIFRNNDMVLNLLSLSAVLVLVCAVRRFSFRNSAVTAVILGAVFYPAMILLGDFALGSTHPWIVLAAGAGVSAAAALILLFFIFNVDYRGSEYLQFEDDDYYYYVKAIPKISARYLKKGSSGGNKDGVPEDEMPPQVKKVQVNDTEIEKKLEDSLKNL